MSSASTRASAQSDRRANGSQHGSDHLAAHRPRMSSTNTSFNKGDRTSMPSPQPEYVGSTAHKRSASGNPRPMSRTAQERSSQPHSRIELEKEKNSKILEERIHETIRTTTRDTVYHRTTSPGRRTASTGEKKRLNESSQKSKQAEPRVKEQLPLVWEPKASLVAHTTAPLAARISIPPLASQAPQSVQPQPLDELTLELQEAAMLEDLLFVFMGYEGQYIRFSAYNPDEERDRLSGPTYRILPGLDPSLLDLTKSMLKMASHYSALEAFVDIQSREEYGSVSNALCASVRKHLQDYLVMVAQLETQFLTNDSFTLHVLNIHTLPTAHMMKQLYELGQELLKKNSLLDDDSEDESDDSENYDQIIESLREGVDLASKNITKKVCKGGGVLALVTKRLESMSGDPAAKALLTSLLRDASRPYMVMLNEWLHHGGIHDPQSEFLIKESKSIRRDRLAEDYTDQYWERRYALKHEDVPPQLVGVKEKIHLAGKYLNVVRECGGVDVSKEIKDVPTSFDDVRLLENVNNAYASANDSLMQLLVTTHQLPERLRSLKHYFFLDPSDFFLHFIDLAYSELRKPAKVVNVGKLQSLLDLVLRQPGSVVSLDPFKEDLKLEMDEISLMKRLQRVVNISGMEQGEVLSLTSQPVESDQNATGFSSLQLDYAVPFPVSLVISRKTIWRYQSLFRFLFQLRHLESQLSTMWQSHGRGFVWSYRSSNRRIEIFKRRVWALRSRMLVFVQQMLYFCTAEVIEPNWQALMGRLKGKGEGNEGPTRTVDELMQDHVDFLDTCLKECMLTNSKLLKINSKLTQTCSYFALKVASQLNRDIVRADPDLCTATKPPKMSDKAWREISSALKQQKQPSAGSAGKATDLSTIPEEERIPLLYKELARWESYFSHHLQILMDALNHYAATETVVLLSLCARLSTVNQGTEFSGMGREDTSGIS